MKKNKLKLFSIWKTMLYLFFMCVSMTTYSQNKITDTITDQSGIPIAGVNILEIVTPNGGGFTESQNIQSPRLNDARSSWNQRTAQFSFGYYKTFGENKIGALLLYEQVEIKSNGISAFRDGFLGTSVDQFIEGSTENALNKGLAREEGRLGYVMMPEMDGIQMCHNIRSDVRTSHIPVILLTARTSSKIQKIGYETGADVYLTKPFDAATLKSQVLNILKSRQHLIDKFKKGILLEPKEITIVSTDEVFLKKAMKIIEENIANIDFNVNYFIDKMHMS